MSKILVTKFDGSCQRYLQEKVVSSLLRSGIKKEKVSEILFRIEAQLFNGITTRQLYDIVFQEIDKEGLKHNSRIYRLREALAKMGPIEFEKFCARILEKKGYICQWNKIVQGNCVEHQIDVVAGKEEVFYYVEVKHHRNYHRQSDLGNVTELWGRLEDLQSGYKKDYHKFNFKAAWLFTNTKFSDHAKQYAVCKGLWLTGWKYGFEGSKSSRETMNLEQTIKLIGEKETDNLIRKVIYKDQTILLKTR